MFFKTSQPSSVTGKTHIKVRHFQDSSHFLSLASEFLSVTAFYDFLHQLKESLSGGWRYLPFVQPVLVEAQFGFKDAGQVIVPVQYRDHCFSISYQGMHSLF